MLRVNQYRLYELGMKLHPLANLPDPALYRDYFLELFESRNELLSLRDELPLRVCKPTLDEAIRSIDIALPRDWQQAVSKLSDENAALPTDAVFRIADAIKNFEPVLAAELQALDTYFVSQKGTYSTPDLIERAENMFPESIRIALPSAAVADWREAGRCIAFDTPTAAGFHILRAVESVMADYYFAVIGKSIPTRMRNWGVYIRKLKESGNADVKITEFLDHIRENYRNPVSHPEVILSLDEVEVLLGAASSCIRSMIISIQNRGKHPQQSGAISSLITIPQILPIASIAVAGSKP